MLSGTMCCKFSDLPLCKCQVIKPHISRESLFSTGGMNIDAVVNSAVSTQHYTWIEQLTGLIRIWARSYELLYNTSFQLSSYRRSEERRDIELSCVTRSFSPTLFFPSLSIRLFLQDLPFSGRSVHLLFFEYLPIWEEDNRGNMMASIVKNKKGGTEP